MSFAGGASGFAFFRRRLPVEGAVVVVPAALLLEGVPSGLLAGSIMASAVVASIVSSVDCCGGVLLIGVVGS